MATGDLDYLRLQLADMVSARTFLLLPENERTQADAVINTAYRECYADREGKRPSWAHKPFSYLVPAPVTFTATLTLGATSIASPSVTLDANFAGSRLRIGTRWFTYAGKDATSPTPVDQLVEPWPDATGSQTLTIYHSSRLLPTDFVDLSEKPEIVGRGKLSPMTNRGEELDYRSGFRDFRALPGAGYNHSGDIGLIASMETGEPLWYYVDSESVTNIFAVRSRFCLYPLPDGAAKTVVVRHHFLPALLTSGTELPKLPADCVVDILLPIARYEWACTNRRYAGNNKRELAEKAEKARERLDTFRVRQRGPMARIVAAR
jgi:hypothetical protein